MTTLGWIHLSKSFRNRIDSILDMLDEEGMVDELGVGAFRDAFADSFFPGISTIQTRARYFFIVSYLIQDYWKQGNVKKQDLGSYLDDQEHEIMWELAAKYNFDRNSNSGVIGITKRPKNRIVRRPSSIYWNGLRTLGFIQTNLSLSEYIYRTRETLDQKISRKVSMESEDSDDADVDFDGGHLIKVSTYKPGWRDGLDLPLTFEEADFFRKQIIRSVPDSLLGQLIANNELRKHFMRTKDFSVFAETLINQQLKPALKHTIFLAHDLNEVVKGLHLVYCNEINQLFHKHDEFYQKWLQWSDSFRNNLLDTGQLNYDNLSMIAPQAGYYSREFMKQVLELVSEQQLNYQAMAKLVREQERNIKGPKSRFRPGAEIDFRKGDQRSLSYLNYRYTNAKTIINDIFTGIKSNA